MNGPVGVLLAAGRSTRFGADKLLHPLADGTPIAVASARALRAATERAVAVVRPDQGELARLLAAEGLETVLGDHDDRGMAATLARGVGETRDAAGWIVALADMPFVRPETVVAVVRAIADGASICAPEYRGRRGHPVGFSAQWGDQLVALQGDQGARRLIERHRQRLRLLRCDDPGTLQDVDLPTDLPFDSTAPLR